MPFRCFKFSLLALPALLCACSGMPDKPLEGLPPLLVTEHRIEPEELLKHCGKAMEWWHWALLSTPVACAAINFDRRTCDIYVTTNADPETLEHERRHCEGYDHGDKLQTAYNAWRAANSRQIASKRFADPLPTPSSATLANPLGMDTDNHP